MTEPIIQAVVAKTDPEPPKTKEEIKKEKQRIYARERYHKKKAEKSQGEKSETQEKPPAGSDSEKESDAEEEEVERIIIKKKKRQPVEEKVRRRARTRAKEESDSEEEEEDEGVLYRIYKNGYVRSALVAMSLYALSKGLSKIREIKDGMDAELVTEKKAPIGMDLAQKLALAQQLAQALKDQEKAKAKEEESEEVPKEPIQVNPESLLTMDMMRKFLADRMKFDRSADSEEEEE